jgi:O-antigen ligase
MALVLFNLALRRARRRDRLALIVLVAANVIHQLISLTRGYWMGLAVGFLLSAILYAGRGPQARPRWRRVLGISGGLAGFAVVGVAVAGAVFGWRDLAGMFGTRLVSSLGTQQSSETASNFERVLEWATSMRRIAEAPWLGHGLGFTLHVRYPFMPRASTQWFLHQLYLWMWVKQGLMGVALLVTVLVTAIRTGMRNARRLGGLKSGWAAGAAAATAYVATLGLTNYPMAQVNSTFLMVLLWGIALSLGNPPRWRVVWREPAGGGVAEQP